MEKFKYHPADNITMFKNNQLYTVNHLRLQSSLTSNMLSILFLPNCADSFSALILTIYPSTIKERITKAF